MWQDNEIRFDTVLSDMQVRHGEFIIDRLDMIEDLKGNAGDQGRLLITNLRIMWHSLNLPRINLSIGYNTIINITIKNINMGNITQALHILTMHKHYRYEFIFNNLNTKSTRHYTSVIGVYRAYASTRVYREIKLRGGFIQDKRLNVLPLEYINSTTPGIWNLSAEQGNIGTFVVTNIRIVWFADVNYQFNVSLPYLAMTNVNIKSSKFGPTLVLSSGESNGSYILGFRIDPILKLNILYKEITTLKESFDKTPIYGVEYTIEYQGVCDLDLKENGTKEVEDIDDEISNVFGLYFKEATASQRAPCYSLHLGLAAEEPREGSSLQNLWELLPAT